MRALSYERNVFPHQFEMDIPDIQEHGFDTIVFTLGEEDKMNFSNGFRSLVDIAKSYDFDVWVDPHCIGNNFGLGRYSGLLQENPKIRRRDKNLKTVNHACPSSYEYIKYMTDWVEFVAEVGADCILWDEPNLSKCYCGDCHDNQMYLLIDALSSLAAVYGLFNSFCIHCMDWKEDRDMNYLYQSSEMSYIDSISLSMVPGSYANFDDDLEEYIGIWAKNASRVVSQYRKPVSMWLQAYDIPDNKEKSITTSMNIAKSYGIEDFAIWGYAGNPYSNVPSKNPNKVWEEIDVAFGGSR